MSYTLNTTVHPLDAAAAEVTFKMTNFKDAILRTPNGSFLRSKAFCVGGGKFCLRVYPCGITGQQGKVSAYLVNMSENEVEIDLQMSVKEVTGTLNCGKIGGKKSWGWLFQEASKESNTVLLMARVYVWKFENNVMNATGGEELVTKMQKMEPLAKDDLKSQVEQMRSGVKTEVERMTTEVKQMKAEVISDMIQMKAEIKTEVKNVKAEVIRVKAETKTELLNLKSEVVKMKEELMTDLKKKKEEKDVTSNREAKSKEELARLESKLVAEVRGLKAEVAKAKSQPPMPECPICMQDMNPPTRIFMCQMGHKLCESCWMKPGLLNCPGHCGTPFIGRDLGMEAFLRQLTGRN